MYDEKYNEIAQMIITHHKYGKANPVDIGLEYGYKKEEIEEFIDQIKQQRG